MARFHVKPIMKAAPKGEPTSVVRPTCWIGGRFRTGADRKQCGSRDVAVLPTPIVTVCALNVANETDALNKSGASSDMRRRTYQTPGRAR